MARREIYRNTTISFYEDEAHLYEKVSELAVKNKQSMRSALMIVLENYFDGNNISTNEPKPITKPEDKHYESVVIDPATKKLFGDEGI